jgi:hypothetical protein
LPTAGFRVHGWKPVGTTPGVTFRAVVAPDGEVEMRIEF